MYKLVFLFTVLVVKGGHGDTSLGKCTDVEPMPGFNMNRLFGLWYAIQTSSTSSPCLSYYIFQDGPHAGQYKITEIQQHSTIWPSALHHEHNITGQLTALDPSTPGRMDLDLPLEIGTSTFTVFLTDYDNYVAIFTCKKMLLIHNWSATILSRTRTLDMAFVDKIRTRLSSYNIDPFSLKIVSQELCPKPGAKGGLVKSATNIATNVRDKASNVIGNVGGLVSSLISDSNVQKAEENVSDVVHNVQEGIVGVLPDNTVSNVRESVSSFASDVRGNISNVVDNVGEKVNSLVVDGTKQLDLEEH